MKKIVFTLFALILFFKVSFAVDFYSGSYQQALAKAKTENKSLLLYFTATWCGPCKYMQQYIFPDTTLSIYIKQHYIALKLDVDTKEGKLIYLKMHQPAGPRGVPAFIISNANEEVLKKAVGGMKTSQLLDFLMRNKEEMVLYRALADSLAQKQLTANHTNPTLFERFMFHSMVSRWKPGIKAGMNLMHFSGAAQSSASLAGSEIGLFFETRSKNNRYSFEPGLLFTSKGGRLVKNGSTQDVNINYLELGLFNGYIFKFLRHVKPLRKAKFSINPYTSIALGGNEKWLNDRQKVNFIRDYYKMDYGFKAGMSMWLGTVEPFIGYNVGLRDMHRSEEVNVYNRGFYLSFAIIFGN